MRFQRLESSEINDSTIQAARHFNKLNPLTTVTTKHVEAYVESLTEKMDQSLPTIRENVKFIKAAMKLGVSAPSSSTSESLRREFTKSLCMTAQIRIY